MERMPAKRLQTVHRRLQQSMIEVSELKKRDFRCPGCGYKAEIFYSDLRGHLQFKCQRCKGVFIINVAYFRRMKGVRRDNH